MKKKGPEQLFLPEIKLDSFYVIDNYLKNLNLLILCLLGYRYPTVLQALSLPNFKTKEGAWSQQQTHQWLNGWEELICPKQSPGATPHLVQ